MFGSTILDVGVGLIFTFLVVSLTAATVTEALASVTKWRAHTLLKGIQDLLNDPQFTGLAASLYQHALINPRGSGVAAAKRDRRSRPSYIDPQSFAKAFVDVTGIAGGDAAQIKAAYPQEIRNDPQLGSLLDGIVARAGGDLDRIRSELAAWFDTAMDRVSGVYKRQAQLCSFLVAFVLAIGLNVNAIAVAKALWVQPMLTKSLAMAPGTAPADALKQLDELRLPVGWTAGKARAFCAGINWAEAIGGWFITAVATLFGAPFWFDLLQNIVRLKGSGASPDEKRKSLGAAA